MLITPPVAADTAFPPGATAAYDSQSTENLDPALLAEMRRQNELQPALTAIWDAALKDPQSGFAGVAFEGVGLSVYWKGDLTPEMSDALTEARRIGQITVKPAAYSVGELRAAGKKIHDAIDRHGGSQIQSIGYEPDGSRLEVTRQPGASTLGPTTPSTMALRDKTSVAQILADAQVSVPVSVVDATQPVNLLSSRADDSSPWNGGNWWEAWRGGDQRMTCTTGFGVHVGSHSYVLSAGHCGSPPDVAYQGEWPTDAFTEMGPVYDDDWHSDLLLINAPGWYLIFDGGPVSTVTKAVHGWGYWAANELVCQSGKTSGVVCGLKQVKSVDLVTGSADSDGDVGYTINGLIQTTQIDGATAAKPGDSGAPVFTLDGAGVRAKGVVSAGGGTTMYFQDWADVISVFNAYPNTTSSTS